MELIPNIIQVHDNTFYPKPTSNLGGLLPTDREDYWDQTGLRTTSGPRVESTFELTRRVSSRMYREKSGFVSDARKLEKHLDESTVQGIKASEWQTQMPSQRTTYLAGYLKYVRYLLAGLADIIKVYSDKMLRYVVDLIASDSV